MKLIFATNNIHKVQEIRAALNGTFEIVSLKEAGIDKDIPEPHPTLEANAAEKAKVIYALTTHNCFSEDTGLEVAALEGAPGVHSARYAGEHASYQNNIDKLLHQMQSRVNRKARFRTVISLLLNGTEIQFEGICDGNITTQAMGDNGFGYDPVFIPEGAHTTFAQMTLEEKKGFSHRAKALAKLVLYLNQQSLQ